MYFQIEGTDVRVLGSMHLFPAGTGAIPQWVRAAYEWSAALVLESDGSKLLPYFKAELPESLQAQLPPRIWSALQSIWPTSGPLSPLSGLRPWAAMLSLTILSQKTVGGIEPHFVEWATNDRKTIEFLEEANDTAASFDSASLADIKASLELVVSDPSLPQRGLETIHSAWLTGDRQQLFAAARNLPLFTFSSLRKSIREDRNRAWVRPIEQHLRGKVRKLIVVGALHLCGPGSPEEHLGRELVPLS